MILDFKEFSICLNRHNITTHTVKGGTLPGKQYRYQSGWKSLGVSADNLGFFQKIQYEVDITSLGGFAYTDGMKEGISGEKAVKLNKLLGSVCSCSVVLGTVGRCIISFEPVKED